MSLKKREKILLALGVSILLGGFLLTQGESVPSAQTGAASQVGHDAEESAILARHLLPDQTLSVKDPFYLNTPQTQTRNTNHSEQVAPVFSLEGIFSDTQGHAAVINGTVVHLGDSITESIIVKSIQGNRVILSSDGQDILLDF